MRTLRRLAGTAVIALTLGDGGYARAGDAKLPDYRAPGSLVDGEVRCIAENVLSRLVGAWMEGFGEACPGVNFQVDAKFDAATAVVKLARGVYGVLPMSRELRVDEIDSFVKSAGHAPTAIRVALRAVPVFVHGDNPVASMTLPQLDAAFSSTRKRGAPADLLTWGQLGLTGDWAERPITLFGRDDAAAAHGDFQDAVLSGGRFKSTVVVVPDTHAMNETLKRSLGGIGYDAPRADASGIRILRVVGGDGKPYEPTDADVQTGKYPITRALFLYVDRAPKKPLRPAIREFVRFVLSRQGQEIVTKGGFVSLAAASATKERTKVE